MRADTFRLFLISLFALFGQVSQASVLYQVTVDYEGGYHYHFAMEFADAVGIKTEQDLLNPSSGSWFTADPQSEFGRNSWEPTEPPGFRFLRFDSNSFGLEFEVGANAIFHWVSGVGNIPLPPPEPIVLSAQTCGLSHIEALICTTTATPDDMINSVQRHARAGISINVPEPPMPALVVLSLLVMAWIRRRVANA